MQTENKNKELINKLCKLLEEKVFEKDMANWTEKSFKNLSTEIEKESGVTVSANTLKRISGKTKMNDDYQPQEGSLDGICIYLGYEGWNHYRKSELSPEIYAAENEELAQKLYTKKNKRSSFFSKTVIISLFTAFGILIGGALFLFFLKHPNAPTGAINETPAWKNVSLYADKVVTETLPCTVQVHSYLRDFRHFAQPLNFILFKSKIHPLNSQSFNKTEMVIEDPGVSWIKLFVNNKIISQIHVLAKTQGWEQSHSSQKLSGNHRIKIKPQPNNTLLIPKSSKENRININKFMETGIDGNDFHAEFDVSFIDENHNNKADLFITLTGQLRKIYTEVIGVNSVVKPYVKLGDDQITDTEVLEKFRKPLNKQHTINIKVENGVFHYRLDKQLIYSQEFDWSVGELLGLTFSSRTDVEVSRIVIKNNEATAQYIDDLK